MKQITSYHIDSALVVLLFTVLGLHFFPFFPLGKTIEVFVLMVSAIVGVLPVLWGALHSFLKKEWASMELLASIALLFSLLSGEWVSAVFIELMLAAARILDDLTQDRTEKSIRGLLQLRPRQANVEKNSALVKVEIANISVDDIVVVGIGERIPIDGIVLTGTAAVDESSLTGESMPIDKEPGNTVLSSTLVTSGSLKIKTTHVGKETTLERVIALVESARKEKPQTQTLGEKFGKLYLVAIFAGSILLYFLTKNLQLVLAVVLVVCADDIAIAIPITYLRAIRAAASMGVIIKGAKYVEQIGQIDTVIFDKTGTLTTGVFSVNAIVPVQGKTQDAVVFAAATAAIRSTHPLSRAIVAYAKSQGWEEEFPDFSEEKGGRGVVASKHGQTIHVGKELFLTEKGITIPRDLLARSEELQEAGNSISYVVQDQTVIGSIAASDTVKKNAITALLQLRELGIRHIGMLTGDSSAVAKSVASVLRIDDWHAELLPEDKVEFIKKLQAQKNVVMVGDGVNDAAALSIASVGVAMGGLGTEGTIDSAQIILMRDDLSTLPETIRLARRVREISIQDFWIWGASNGVGLLLVFTGIIGPAGAAAYNFLSDFLPLFNSMRVTRVQKKL